MCVSHARKRRHGLLVGFLTWRERRERRRYFPAETVATETDAETSVRNRERVSHVLSNVERDNNGVVVRRGKETRSSSSSTGERTRRRGARIGRFGRRKDDVETDTVGEEGKGDDGKRERRRRRGRGRGQRKVRERVCVEVSLQTNFIDWIRKRTRDYRENRRGRLPRRRLIELKCSSTKQHRTMF